MEVNNISTDAKRAGNARYLAGFKTISVRMKPAEAEQLREEAERVGESVAGYILQAESMTS